MVSTIERFHYVQDSQLGPRRGHYREDPLYNKLKYSLRPTPIPLGPNRSGVGHSTSVSTKHNMLKHRYTIQIDIITIHDCIQQIKALTSTVPYPTGMGPAVAYIWIGNVCHTLHCEISALEDFNVASVPCWSSQVDRITGTPAQHESQCLTECEQHTYTHIHTCTHTDTHFLECPTLSVFLSHYWHCPVGCAMCTSTALHRLQLPQRWTVVQFEG